MRQWLRPAGLLTGVFVVALGLTWLGWRQTQPDETWTGSSSSFAPDGAQALFQWTEELGGRAERLNEPRISSDAVPRRLVVIAPRLPIGGSDRAAFDAVPRAGGTLVVAADGPLMLGYLTELGVRLDPLPATATSASTPNGDLAFPVAARYRLRTDGATPLLLAPNGEWLAIRKPYLGGELVVLSMAGPLTNEGLRNPDAARWVYREVLRGFQPGERVAFDESHYELGRPDSDGPSFANMVVQNDVGRAVALALGVAFVYLLLGGRRLGPPRPAFDAGSSVRTMYEHVQALAGLYRRARQLPFLREHYLGHYRRGLASSLGSDPVELLGLGEGAMAERIRARGIPAGDAEQLATALQDIAGARTESELLRAVQHAETAMAGLPRFKRGTLLAA